MLAQLLGLGVRVPTDDFVIGRSSLGSLQKFSFDRIKIDGFPVCGPEAGRSNGAITSVRASLGMRTTTQGVETLEPRDRMRLEGCTEVQVFLTGRSLPAEVATALLCPVSSREPPTSDGE